MKRDMDLILEILRSQEEERKIDGSYSEDAVVYHAQLLSDAGLIEAEFLKGIGGTARGAAIIRLTWEGHEFLDATRDQSIWEKTKKNVIKPGSSFTFGLIVEYLKHEARSRIAPLLGLPPNP